MKKLYSKLSYALIFAFTLFISNKTYASHMEGADLKFKCLGGNLYEITLSFYRDCSGITHGTSVNINIASASCGQNLNITANQTSIVEASPLCAAQLSQSTCNGGTLPGVQLITYVGTVTLPMACNDWIVSWFDGSRNAAVTNLANPSSMNMYVEGRINNLNVTCNNSPDFTTPPVPYICAGVPYQYNHGVIDPEGDSLRYTMITPLSAAGTPIAYNAGFSVTTPMTMTGGLVFDPQTGQMNFTPNGTQVVAVAIRVDEYRNGILIGSVIRDMQIVVINCSNNPPTPGNVTGLTGATLSGNVFTTCPGNVMNFSIPCTDADAGQVISTISTLTTNLPGCNVVVSGTSPTTITVTWTVPAIPLPFYNFSITWKDNACPILGQQTKGFLINTGPDQVITPSSYSVCPAQTVTLTAQTAGNYVWSTGATTQSIIVNPSVATTYTVTSTILGCTAKGVITVSMLTNVPISVTSNPASVCAGSTVTLTAGAATNYNWSTGSTTQTTTITPSGSTTYTVTGNVGTCTGLGTITINPGSVPATSVNICPGTSGTLTSSYGCPVTSSTSINQGTNFNMGALTASDPLWDRTYTTCTTYGATSFYYDVFAFTVSTAGSYTFNGCFPNIDAYGQLFQNAFNPASPCAVPANFITGNDDSAPSCGADPQLVASLTPGVTYYIISTSYSTFATDTYTWTFSGPAGATLITGTPGVLEWYTSASGGTALGTGPAFNPVGVAGSGLANTNTPGTTTYYVACSGNPSCRSGVDFKIGIVSAVNATTCVGGSGSLSSAYSCPNTSGPAIAQGATFNSGTLATTDPTFIRPYATGPCSSSGTSTYYDSYAFTVSMAGTYTFDGCFPGIDGYGFIYQTSFSAASPCTNFVLGNDDSAPLCGADPQISVALVPGVTYYIISCSYGTLATDAYSWTYTGPAGATVNSGTGGGPGVLNWFTTASGGTAIGTGTPFNPVGVAGSGLANTNTAGTYTYYVACSNDLTCRTAVNFVITPGSSSITSVPVGSPLCPNTSITLAASGGTAGTGSTINWYTGPGGTGTLLGTGSSITYSAAATTTVYVRRQGGCSAATPDFPVVLNVRTYTYAANGTTSNNYCTDDLGWNHFYVGNNIIYSVNGNISGAPAGYPIARINVNGTYFQSPGIASPNCFSDEKFEMSRSWNLDMGGGASVAPYDVRFYYQPAERTAIETAAANWMTTYPGCGYTYRYANPWGFYWFKNVSGNYLAPIYDATIHPTQAAIGTTPNGINYAQLTGISSFSGGSGAVYLRTSVFLNVSYKNFDGESKGNYNHLYWSTLSENNNSHFNVESSADGINFKKIGQVAGSGTTSDLRNYEFDDMHPYTGMNYYRLEQVDFDNTVEYSNVIELSYKKVAITKYEFYPNPTESIIKYQFTTDINEQVQIEIIDVLGQVSDAMSYTVNAGLNTIDIDLKNHKNGTYMIRATHKNSKTVHIKTIAKVSN